MMKKVQAKLNKVCSVSLVLAGWAAFAAGILINESMTLKLIFLSAARVLP